LRSLPIKKALGSLRELITTQQQQQQQQQQLGTPFGPKILNWKVM